MASMPASTTKFAISLREIPAWSAMAESRDARGDGIRILIAKTPGLSKSTSSSSGQRPRRNAARETADLVMVHFLSFDELSSESYRFNIELKTVFHGAQKRGVISFDNMPTVMGRLFEIG
jgi:hypothetical protein